MDSVLLNLTVEFRLKVNELVRICSSEGVEIHPYCGLRTCAEQAKLFRKTRSRKDIEQKMQSLRDRGLPELAAVLELVGPQEGILGQHVTKAGPGESWHQYGRAVDCVPLVGGKAMWSDAAPEWKIYGIVANQLGLTWAGDWVSFKEFPHVQQWPSNSPIQYLGRADLVLAQLREIKSV